MTRTTEGGICSGILEICGDEDGLAAVISHEIAHTVAHHASERMSRGFVTLAGLLLISIASGWDTRFLGDVMDLVFLRPGSRKQEVSSSEETLEFSTILLTVYLYITG